MMAFIDAMIAIFSVMGLMCVGIEVLFDNTSHRAMFLVGGIAGVVAGLTYESFPNVPFILITLIMATEVLVIEYIGGRIFNKNHTIWNYSHLKFNLHGQVCLHFGLVWWAVISPLIIWMWETLRDVSIIELLKTYIRFIG